MDLGRLKAWLPTLLGALAVLAAGVLIGLLLPRAPAQAEPDAQARLSRRSLRRSTP